jgi:ankyrin repeat protein
LLLSLCWFDLVFLSSSLSTSLFLAQYNDVAMLEFLLKLEAKTSSIFEVVNKRKNSVLHIADSQQALEFLLQLDSSEGFVGKQNCWGETALHLAAQAGNVKGYALLEKAGGKKISSILDQWNRTAGMVAEESCL